MAAPRDQAARVLRSEPDEAEGGQIQEASAALAEALRAHLADEAKRHPAEAPTIPPAIDNPPAATPHLR
jgi:membrane fusion protein, multidrug efflux system